METLLKALSEDEKAQIHERTLKILSETGVQVHTEKGENAFKMQGLRLMKTQKLQNSRAPWLRRRFVWRPGISPWVLADLAGT